MELKLKKATAKKLYPESPDWFKEELEEAFGKECFQKRRFDEIKTFEDACEELGIDPESVIHDADTMDERAYKKLKVIIKAINQGWIPDWDNGNQEKWWPWFNLSSGFGFDDSYYLCTYTDTCVGSRLCFESKEKSDYCVNKFLNLYKTFLT
jgi:hypothetical protein